MMRGIAGVIAALALVGALWLLMRDGPDAHEPVFLEDALPAEQADAPAVRLSVSGTDSSAARRVIPVRISVVTGADKTPVEGAQVYLRSGPEREVVQATTNEAGVGWIEGPPHGAARHQLDGEAHEPALLGDVVTHRHLDVVG